MCILSILFSIIVKIGNTMEDFEIDLLLKYPLMCCNDERTQYEGFLQVNGVEYDICLQVPSEELEGFHLKVTPQLRKFKSEIDQLTKIADDYSVIEFLDRLREILASKTEILELKNFSNHYRHIINEFMEFRQFYFNIHKCVLANDLSNVSIAYMDGESRVHELKIAVDFKETENIFKVVEFSFPTVNNKKEIFKPSNSLKMLYEIFFTMVEKLQPFFTLMDNLDEVCRVLDPSKPTRKDCYRRIALGGNFSVIVTIDPWCPSNPPDLKFLGSEKQTEEFREKISNNLEKWDKLGDFVTELLKLLEMDSFPVNENENTDEIVLYASGECCICFSSRLNEKLPEIICPNSSCEQFFHQECLYQWLTSVSVRKSLNKIHGNCPNCDKCISCPIR